MGFTDLLERTRATFGELTVTANANFGEVPRGVFVGVDGVIGWGPAARFSAGYSSRGGFFFSVGFGYGFAAYFGGNGGIGGYMKRW